MSREISNNIKKIIKNTVKSCGLLFVLALAIVSLKATAAQAQLNFKSGDGLLMEFSKAPGQELPFVEIDYIEKATGNSVFVSFSVDDGYEMIVDGTIEKGTIDHLSPGLLEMVNAGNVSGNITLQNDTSVLNFIPGVTVTRISLDGIDAKYYTDIAGSKVEVTEGSHFSYETPGINPDFHINFKAISQSLGGNPPPQGLAPVDEPQDESILDAGEDNQVTGSDEGSTTDRSQGDESGVSDLDTGLSNASSGCSLSFQGATDNASPWMLLLGLFLGLPVVIRLRQQA